MILIFGLARMLFGAIGRRNRSGGQGMTRRRQKKRYRDELRRHRQRRNY